MTLLHGIDLVEIDRVRRMLGDHGERFLARCFTDIERRYCLAKADPAPHLAARFAAKEATLKALGTGLSDGIQWIDVAVRSADDGRPQLVLAGRAAERAKEIGVNSWVVSLSHTRSEAIASVVAVVGRRKVL